MELRELKPAWAELDQWLAERLRNPRFTRQHVFDRTSSALRRVRLMLSVEVGVDLVLVLLVGSYLGDNIGTLRFAVPAVTLHVVAIAAIIAAAAQLVALGRVHYTDPVVALQKRVERLRVVRTRVHRWLLMLAPLLWTPLAIVGAHAVFGIDVYQTFGGPWIAANIAFGLAALVVAMALSRRYSQRMHTRSVLRAIAEMLAGDTVMRAVACVNELAAFETEGTASAVEGP